MAEFVMKDMLRHAGIEDVDVESAALHTDEIGGDIHPGTKRKLRQEGIPFGHRAAWLLTAAKARRYDMIIGMDAHNRRDLQRLLPADEQHKNPQPPGLVAKPQGHRGPMVYGGLRRNIQRCRRRMRRITETPGRQINADYNNIIITT